MIIRHAHVLEHRFAVVHEAATDGLVAAGDAQSRPVARSAYIGLGKYGAGCAARPSLIAYRVRIDLRTPFASSECQDRGDSVHASEYKHRT
jgi:hypothetical protein